MDKIGKIKQEIESVRSALNALVALKNTTDHEVTRLSTCLDKLIVRYERQKAKLNRQRG